MDTCSPKYFCCSQCDYTTTRSFNLKRHIGLMHHEVHDTKGLNVVNDVSNVVKPVSNVVNSVSNVVDNVSNVVDTSGHGNKILLKCEHCYRTFSSHVTLKRHQPVCKRISHPNECEKCGLILGDRHAKSKHVKTCTGPKRDVSTNDNLDTSPSVQPAPPTVSTVNSHNTTIHNITNNNQNYHNHFHTTEQVKVLVFPENEEVDFDFIVSHIKDQVMKEIMTTRPPSFSFRKFMRKVFSNKQNRYIRKGNIKDKYSSVHLGNNKWGQKRDETAMPIVVQNMTTAALGMIIDMKHRKVLNDNGGTVRDFVEYVKAVNRGDDKQKLEYTIEEIKEALVELRVLGMA